MNKFRSYTQVTLSLVLALTGSVSHLSSAWALPPANSNQAVDPESPEELNAFLKRTGIDPIAHGLNADDPKDLQKVAVIELSRQLAIRIFKTAGPRIETDVRVRARMLELTARLLTFGLTGKSEELRERIKRIPDETERTKEALKSLRQDINEALHNDINMLLEHILATVYTAEEAKVVVESKPENWEKLQKDLTNWMLAKYSNPEMSGTSFLGRALAQLLVRHDKVSGKPSLNLHENLRRMTAAKGDNLDKYTSGKIVIAVPSMENGKLQIKSREFSVNPNGTTVTYKYNESLSKEAAASRSLLKKMFGFFGRDKSSGEVEVAVKSFIDPQTGIGSNFGYEKDETGRVLIMDANAYGDAANVSATVTKTTANGNSLKYKVDINKKSKTQLSRETAYSYSAMDPTMRIHQLVEQHTSDRNIPVEIVDNLVRYEAVTEDFAELLADTRIPESTKSARIRQEIAKEALTRKMDLKTVDRKEMTRFLTALGFGDTTEKIRDYIDRGETYHDASQVQQARNLKSYLVEDATRDLAVIIMEKMQEKMNTPEGRQAIANLTGHLAAQQMMPLYDGEAMDLARMRLAEEHPELARKDVDLKLKALMNRHVENLRNDILNSMFGEEKVSMYNAGTLDLATASQIEKSAKEMDPHISKWVDRMYLDYQIGGTKYMGRAMALLVKRIGVESKSSSLEDATREVLISKYGLDFENFVGDDLLIQQEGGKKLRVKAMTGGNLGTHQEESKEGKFIPAGTTVGSESKAIAKKMNLVSSLAKAILAMSIFVEKDDTKDGYSKWEKFREWLVQRYFQEGYSHIGYTVVLTDEVTGIRTTYVVDSHPDRTIDEDYSVKDPDSSKLVKRLKAIAKLEQLASNEGISAKLRNEKQLIIEKLSKRNAVLANAGGLRKGDFHTFVTAAKHTGLVYSTPDIQKLFDAIQRAKAANGGVPPKVGSQILKEFNFYMPKVDETGVPIVANDPKKELQEVPWKLEGLTQTQVDALFFAETPAAAYKIYSKSFYGMVQHLVAKGYIFLWITPYLYYMVGGGYCSFTSLILNSFLGENGLKEFRSPGDWAGVVYRAAKIREFTMNRGVKALKKALAPLAGFAKMLIVPPAELFANIKFIDESSFHTIKLPFQTINKRWTEFSAKYDSLFPDSARALTAKLYQKISGLNDFRMVRFDEQEVNGVAVEEIEKMRVLLGADGRAKQINISGIRMSADEIREVAEKLGYDIREGYAEPIVKLKSRSASTGGLGGGLRCDAIFSSAGGL